MRKQKKKSWHQLKEEKCPKCGSILMEDLFGKGEVGCVCGFRLEKHTKELLVERDNNN